MTFEPEMELKKFLSKTQTYIQTTRMKNIAYYLEGLLK